jgi:hypothetical protein
MQGSPPAPINLDEAQVRGGNPQDPRTWTTRRQNGIATADVDLKFIMALIVAPGVLNDTK